MLLDPLNPVMMAAACNAQGAPVSYTDVVFSVTSASSPGKGYNEVGYIFGIEGSIAPNRTYRDNTINQIRQTDNDGAGNIGFTNAPADPGANGINFLRTLKLVLGATTYTIQNADMTYIGSGTYLFTTATPIALASGQVTTMTLTY